MSQYLIIGLSIFHYLDDNNKTTDKHVFHLKDGNNNVELELYYNKQGKFDINGVIVDRFSGYQYRPKNQPYYLSEELIHAIYKKKDFSCTLFNMSWEQNKYEVHLDQFDKSPRAKSSRPIWIFKGKSGSGKSYLAHILSSDPNMSVYETDSCGTLPDIINHNIIVLGNKYKFTIEEIKSKFIDSYELQIVDFS